MQRPRASQRLVSSAIQSRNQTKIPSRRDQRERVIRSSLIWWGDQRERVIRSSLIWWEHSPENGMLARWPSFWLEPPPQSASLSSPAEEQGPVKPSLGVSIDCTGQNRQTSFIENSGILHWTKQATGDCQCFFELISCEVPRPPWVQPQEKTAGARRLL